MAVNVNKGYSAGKVLRTPAPDEISQVRNPGKVSYGMNFDTTPSSVPPGKAVRSTLGQNLMESSDDGQGVLQKIIEGGVAGRDDRIPADGNVQQRTVSADPYPTTRGMKGASSGPKIPGALVGGEAQPVRKP
jgi:hypothetical protein